ncbi:MAG: PDDEXK nuclease domain-containing protein [Rectinemataceae bacterium]
MSDGSAIPAAVFPEISQLIEAAKKRSAQAVNAELTLLYWNIGQRLQREILGDERAEYGKQIITGLSRQLTAEYSKGWSEKQLWHCLRTAEIFLDEETIVSAVRRQLSWTHIKTLIYIDDPVKREFYLELSRIEGWSSRQLQERIGSLLFERTAISKKPEETIRQDLEALRNNNALSADLAFRDPYILDFLGLGDSFSERDLESAIIAELQGFIVEMGSDFAFLARQKRITIDNRDYYIDLLFYHRRLRRVRSGGMGRKNSW